MKGSAMTSAVAHDEAVGPDTRKGTSTLTQTEEALGAAQREAAWLEGRRTAMFAEFRAAVQAGDGPAMVSVRAEWEASPLLLTGAKIRLQRAVLAHLEPQVEPAQQALKDAQRGLEQARDRLPYGRGDLGGTNPKLIDGFGEARSRYERAQVALSVLTGNIKTARDELLRLCQIRLA